MDMSKYKGMFIEESHEHLKNIYSLLMELEKLSDDQATINNLFREYHSIKGMAASMGYSPITELSHSMEDLLDVIRKQELGMPAMALSVLFSGTDLLEVMVQQIEQDKELEENQDIIEKIRNIEVDLKENDPQEISVGVIFDEDDFLEDLDGGDGPDEILDGDVVLDVDITDDSDSDPAEQTDIRDAALLKKKKK